jgi:hypothetical protein
MQKYSLQKKKKKSSKNNQNPSIYHNSITNLKVQHKAKLSCFKNPRIKIDLLLPRGQNPLSYYTLYNEFETQYPCLGRQRPINKKKLV